jgi:predicted HAD superfamily Cof-like phosphohydrolase
MLAFPYQFNNEVRHIPAPWTPNWFLVQQAMDHCREELKELMAAQAGLRAALSGQTPNNDEVKVRLGDVVDAVHDLRYVAANVLWAMGVPLGIAQLTETEVHLSNMNKLRGCEACLMEGFVGEGDDRQSCPVCGGGGSVVETDINGKIIKPEGWHPPDYAAVFERMEALNRLTMTQMLKGTPETELYHCDQLDNPL